MDHRGPLMEQMRLLTYAERMYAHCARGGLIGRHWDTQARQMLQRLRTHPNASPFSSELFLFDHFGGGAMRPDRSLLRKSLAARIRRRLRTVARQALGYGRIGDAAVALTSDSEALENAIAYGAFSYENAVRTGYELLHKEVEALDVRSPEIFGDQRVNVEGRALAWLTLISLNRALLLRKAIGNLGVVLEIGAGTGELARVLLTSGIAASYVIVDIPPALAVAQEVLLSTFPPDELSLFDGARTSLPDPRHVRCSFLTPDQVNLVARADVGINIASFGEMTPDLVLSYIADVKRLGVGHFVSVNTRKPHPVDRSASLGEAFYVRSFAPEYSVTERMASTKALQVELRPHDEGYAGYQWLHFIRSAS